MKITQKVARYTRKVVALTMALTLVLSMFSFNVSAAGIPAGGFGIEMVATHVGGNEATLEIFIRPGAGFGGVLVLEFDVEYDDSVLTAIDHTVGAGFNATVPPVTLSDGLVEVVFDDIQAAGVADGLVLEIQFEIDDAVEEDDVIDGFSFTLNSAMDMDWEDSLAHWLEHFVVIDEDASFVFLLPSYPATDVTIEIGSVDSGAIDGRDNLTLTLTHDGSGAENFNLVVWRSGEGAQPAVDVIAVTVPAGADGLELETTMFVADTDVVSVWAIPGAVTSFDGEFLAGNALGVASTNL